MFGFKKKPDETKEKAIEIMNKLGVKSQKLSLGDFKKMVKELFEGEEVEAYSSVLTHGSGGTLFITNKRVLIIYLSGSGYREVESIGFSKIDSVNSTPNLLVIQVNNKVFQMKGAFKDIDKKIKEKML